jgi:hypothetical protein
MLTTEERRELEENSGVVEAWCKMRTETVDVFNRWAAMPEYERTIFCYAAPSMANRLKLKLLMLTGLILPVKIYYSLQAALRSDGPFRWKAFRQIVWGMCRGREN